MAKFLNTSATTFYLEEVIKQAKERLWLISPYLKFNDRMKELLEDKNRMKIDVRIVYGKSELQPAEANWLKNLEYVRTSFCQHLHAKCYISEAACIIGSMNLYEFSQVNNHEMGVLILRRDDQQLYKDAYTEAQRIIRISDEVKISLDVVDKGEEPEMELEESSHFSTLTTSKLAEKWGMKTAECNEKLCAAGLQEHKDGKYFLTEAGRAAGGETKKGKFGIFIVWAENLTL